MIEGLSRQWDEGREIHNVVRSLEIERFLDFSIWRNEEMDDNQSRKKPVESKVYDY